MSLMSIVGVTLDDGIYCTCLVFGPQLPVPLVLNLRAVMIVLECIRAVANQRERYTG